MGTIGSSIASSALTGSSSSSGNGIDVSGAVDQILSADRAPERLWQAEQATISARASALQGINSDLHDLQLKVSALNDLQGALGSKSVAVSDSSILTASAAAAAPAGTHTVIVGSLATTSSYYTDYQTTGSTPLSTGTTFSLQVGSNAAVPIPIDGTNNTLDKLAASINKLGMGVTASVVTDAGGARLSVVSNTSGSPGDLTVSSDTTGLGFTKVAGTNASLTVDGVPVSSASNNVTVIPGVTLNLLASSAKQVTINVQPDTRQVTQAINSFVSSYNKIIGDINAQFRYNSNSKNAGVLAGDSTLQLLQQQLYSSITASVSAGNQITTLGSLGVSSNDDGTLSVDDSKLQSALSDNYQDVQKFFQDSSTGFAQTLNSLLTNLADPANGAVTIEIAGLAQSSSAITDQIQRLEDRLTITQQQLIRQYSQINATLEQLPMMLAQINAQLGSLLK